MCVIHNFRILSTSGRQVRKRFWFNDLLLYIWSSKYYTSYFHLHPLPFIYFTFTPFYYTYITKKKKACNKFAREFYNANKFWISLLFVAHNLINNYLFLKILSQKIKLKIKNTCRVYWIVLWCLLFLFPIFDSLRHSRITLYVLLVSLESSVIDTRNNDIEILISKKNFNAVSIIREDTKKKKNEV